MIRRPPRSALCPYTTLFRSRPRGRRPERRDDPVVLRQGAGRFPEVLDVLGLIGGPLHEDRGTVKGPVYDDGSLPAYAGDEYGSREPVVAQVGYQRVLEAHFLKRSRGLRAPDNVLTAVGGDAVVLALARRKQLHRLTLPEIVNLHERVYRDILSRKQATPPRRQIGLRARSRTLSDRKLWCGRTRDRRSYHPSSHR